MNDTDTRIYGEPIEEWIRRATVAETLLTETLNEIIEASRDFTAPNWWVAVERIERIARTALGVLAQTGEGA